MGCCGYAKDLTMVKKITYSIVIFLFSINLISGQIVKFTPEPEKFLKEIQSFLGTVNKVDAKKFVSDFEPIWLGDFFNPDIKAHVYATVNYATVYATDRLRLSGRCESKNARKTGEKGSRSS